MAYSSKSGKRPAEYASKTSHSQVIKDLSVQEFLENGQIPQKAQNVNLADALSTFIKPVKNNPIELIVAIDGGFQEVAVQSEFPSSTICFFQFGALIFSIEDLEKISNQAFIDPEDMAKLKQIQRFKFTMPVKNFIYKKEPTLTHSIRKAIYDFFNQKLDDEDSLNETLKWFIYQEYKVPERTWNLSHCPQCRERNIALDREHISRNYTFECPYCKEIIYLTDVFRLYEAIDDEMGAGGILSYVMTTFEQILLIHIIRLMLKLKPAMLNKILFIKDGPLAFFGQTANMHKPMRTLVNFLFANQNLFLAGLEKSGAFVEHADQIASKLKNSTVLILDNDYIYKYITPGKADPNSPYGGTSYYSNKLIFKTQEGNMFVVSLPTKDKLAYPKLNDFRNLEITLTNLEKLKCDMYDNALLPVALANKLVSLAQFPSSRILQRFAQSKIH
jgi:hypothetical protein